MRIMLFTGLALCSALIALGTLGCGGNVDTPGLDNPIVTMEGKPQPPPGPSLPAGYTIAFHKAAKRGIDQIFTMTGSQTTQVTTGTNTCRRPTWSPPGYSGGPFILYSEGSGLYRIKPDGTGRTQITFPSASQYDETPDWNVSTLGDKVVFRRSDAYDQMWPTVMTRDLATGAEVALAPMDPSPGYWDQTSPSFSPDGLKVAFQAVTWDPVVAYKHGPVFTVDSGGGTATAIPGTEGMQYGQPDWGPTLPDGHSRIVLRDQLGHGLVVIDMDASNQPVGSPSTIISGVDIVAPHWSWDGVYIAADSCYLKADGTGLTTGVGGSGNTWAP